MQKKKKIPKRVKSENKNQWKKRKKQTRVK